MAPLLGPPHMSIGSKHQESGLLVKEGNALLLQRDDGGYWRLEAPRKAYRLVGQRVELVGSRCGFDELIVERIIANGRVFHQAWTMRWQVGAAIAVTLVLLPWVLSIAGWF